jgi:hypothetical protein
MGGAMVPRIAVAVCLVLAALPATSARAAPVSTHTMLYSCCTPFEMKERIFAESAALGAEYVRVDVQPTRAAPRRRPTGAASMR